MDQDDNAQWQYKPDGGGENPADGPSDDQGAPPTAKHKEQSVAWEATEFIEHPHGTNWYAALVLSTIALAAIVFVLTKGDKLATIFILVLGFIVGAIARQKPNQIEYEVSASGLTVNKKLYRYNNFKSFTVIQEGQLSSVTLFPLKKFMPPVSAYFEPAKEENITQVLGENLPYENRQLDTIDRLSRRLRF